jgi:2'-5' RNA ligase
VADEKTLCVMGTFDAETERRFEAIKAKIRLPGCEVDEQPPQLFFGLVGVFPESEVLFAAPSVTQELLDMHATIHTRYDDFCFDKNCLYSLQGGKWIPHITLATPRNCQPQDVLAIILEEFTPFEGEITHLRITEQEPLVEVAAFALR